MGKHLASKKKINTFRPVFTGQRVFIFVSEMFKLVNSLLRPAGPRCAATGCVLWLSRHFGNIASTRYSPPAPGINFHFQ